MDGLKLLIVVTGTAAYAGGKPETGLWLSELTHIYHEANECGYEITVANPKGGNTPVDPESLKPLMLDDISKGYWNNAEFRDMLEHANSLDEVSGLRFDCVYLAGGHGTMFDFPDNAVLQMIIREHYDDNRLVSAICHGVCGLLNVKLPDGEYFVRGKRITGFSWLEEALACRKEVVPFNLEAALKERGAEYKKALIPMTSEVVVDGNLVTGQNPSSSKEMAKVVMRQLNKKRGVVG